MVIWSGHKAVAIALFVLPSLAFSWAGGSPSSVGSGSTIPVTTAPPSVLPVASGSGALVDSAPGTIDARIRRLAGLPAVPGVAAAGWPCNAAPLAQFAAQNLSEASQRTRRVAYFFGGVDFVYPDLLFPNMEHLLLVAMQPIGQIPAEGSVAASHVQGAFSALNGCVGRSTYGITKDMAREQAGLGTSTLIAVAIAARGHRVDAIERVALDANGRIGSSGGIPAVRVSYTKASGQRGEAVYLQMAISDGGLESSGLGPLMRAGQYDTGFYKASMYIPSHQNAANRIVLDNVRYVVQSDDGIPFHQFGAAWDMRLFGTYAAPSSIFGVGAEQELYSAYARAICDATSAEKSVGMSTMSAAWGRQLNEQTCGGLQRTNAQWGGMIPGFPYSYSAASGPGDAGLRLRTSNLIYAIRR